MGVKLGDWEGGRGLFTFIAMKVFAVASFLSAYSFMFSQDEGVQQARDLIVTSHAFTRVGDFGWKCNNQYLIRFAAQMV